MYVLNKKRNEIVKIDISGRIFIKDSTICCGRVDEKPSYLGDYESEGQARFVLKILFDALGNSRNAIFEMPLETDIKAQIANRIPDVERHHVTGKKTKGHGGS